MQDSYVIALKHTDTHANLSTNQLVGKCSYLIQDKGGTFV